MINEFKKGMSTKFKISDLGKLTYYRVIEAFQYDVRITLKQERYAMKILEETCMDKCNAVHAPMDSGLKLSMSQEEMCVVEKEYRRNIGFLRYLLHTRPDLSYCVGVLSQQTETVTCRSIKTSPQIPERHSLSWSYVQTRKQRRAGKIQR